MRIWVYLITFLWDTGRWSILEELSPKIIKLAEGTHKLDKEISLVQIKERSWFHFWKGNIEKEKKLQSKRLKNLTKKIPKIVRFNFMREKRTHKHLSKIAIEQKTTKSDF